MLDNLDNVYETIINILGGYQVILLLISMLGVFVAFIFIWRKLSNLQIALFIGDLKVLLLSFVCFIYFQPLHIHLMQESWDARNQTNSELSNFIDTSQMEAKGATDNIFILVLESLNSVVLTGQGMRDATRYPGFYLPKMQEIAKDGTFIPYLWANTINTDRSLATIFCGSVGNAGDAYASKPETIKVDCLPKILKKSGYHSSFFSGLDQPHFQNKKNFLPRVGFDQMHFADFMKPEDRRYNWGYDDCQMYQRVFDVLEEQHPNPKKKVFAFETSMHHMNFKPLVGHEDDAMFPKASNYTEAYINSALAQDSCLADFYDRYRKYSPENSHLFILGDHSWRVGIKGGGFTDKATASSTYLVPLAYVPPRRIASKLNQNRSFKDLKFAQSDLLPTIVELLSGDPYQNSFAQLLIDAESYPITNPLYEDCHVLVDPYSDFGSTYSVVRGNHKYNYSTNSGVLNYVNLENNILERNVQEIGAGLTFDRFVNSYICKRFKRKKEKFKNEKIIKYDQVHYFNFPHITIEAFVRLKERHDQGQAIAGNYEHSGFLLGIDSKGLGEFIIAHQTGSARVVTDEALPIGSDVHLAGVFNGKQLKLYVNGIQQGQIVDLPSDFRTAFAPFYVGAEPNNNREPENKFLGDILQFRLTSTVLYQENFVPKKLQDETNTYVFYEPDR